MLDVSDGFKEAIKQIGRELDVQLIWGAYTFTGEDIKTTKGDFDGEPFSTIMRHFEIVLSQEAKILQDRGFTQTPQKGDTIDLKIGVKVAGEFEYITFKDLIVYDREDAFETEEIRYTIYDKMLYTMVDFNVEEHLWYASNVITHIETSTDEEGNINDEPDRLYPSKIDGELIEAYKDRFYPSQKNTSTILTKILTSIFGSSKVLSMSGIPNANVTKKFYVDYYGMYCLNDTEYDSDGNLYYEGTPVSGGYSYEFVTSYGKGQTVRDVLDDICKATGIVLFVTPDGKINYRAIGAENPVWIIGCDQLLSLNIGKNIQYTVFTYGRSPQDDNVTRPTYPISPFVEFRINNCQFVDSRDDRERFIDAIYDNIRSEYDECSFKSTGSLFFEPFDRIFVIDDREPLGRQALIYVQSCSWQINNGLTEDISCDEFVNNSVGFKEQTPVDNKDITDALIEVRKQKAEILLKVSKNGVIAEIEASADKGIRLSGKAITLDGDTVVDGTFAIKQGGSTVFSLDDTGTMIANKGSVGGWNLNNDPLYNVDGTLTQVKNGRVVTIRPYDPSKLGASIISYRKQNGILYLPIFEVEQNGNLNVGDGSSLNVIHALNVDPQYASFCKMMVKFESTGDSYFAGSAGGYNYKAKIQSNGVVYAMGYENNSSKHIKKNFEPVDSVKDIIKNSEIWKYNLLTEEDDHKKHYGFVIGDGFVTPDEVINDDAKEKSSSELRAVDLYTTCSILWKAVQELTAEIEELKAK